MAEVVVVISIERGKKIISGGDGIGLSIVAVVEGLVAVLRKC